MKLKKTYQLNTGGNTDFLNMLDKTRLVYKKTSKTEAVQSQVGMRLNDKNIHIGPSDWVAWQKDNKVCFLRMEGNIFGNLPIELELRLSVQDSPNSAGVVIDAIRCMKLALERNQGGILYSPSAFFMKHPPMQLSDEEAAESIAAESSIGTWTDVVTMKEEIRNKLAAKVFKLEKNIMHIGIDVTTFSYHPMRINSIFT